MLLAKRRRLEHAHIATDNRSLAKAEQALGGGVERLDDSLFADHDRGVGHGIEHRAQMRLARARRSRAISWSWRRVRQSCSPNQEMPMPTAAKIAASTISGLVKFSMPSTKIPKIRLRAVATRPGPNPPAPAASRMAGMKRRKAP